MTRRPFGDGVLVVEHYDEGVGCFLQEVARVEADGFRRGRVPQLLHDAPHGGLTAPHRPADIKDRAPHVR
jgi:hypothetical protein